VNCKEGGGSPLWNIGVSHEDGDAGSQKTSVSNHEPTT